MTKNQESKIVCSIFLAAAGISLCSLFIAWNLIPIALICFILLVIAGLVYLPTPDVLGIDTEPMAFRKKDDLETILEFYDELDSTEGNLNYKLRRMLDENKSNKEMYRIMAAAVGLRRW